MEHFLPGLRIIKTFIAVLLCLLFFHFIEYQNPMHAAVACVLMMKSTPEETISVGKLRVFGTILGGFVSYFPLLAIQRFEIQPDSVYMAFAISGAVLIALIICKGFRYDTYVSSTSAVLILIILMSQTIGTENAFLYVFYRTLETLIGIAIAFFVNRYLNFGSTYNKK